jgi:hypothetical protein
MSEPISPSTYLTTEELAELIKYDARTIRNRLKDSVLLEGVHYIRPFGGRKILFLREAIERDISAKQRPSVDLGRSTSAAEVEQGSGEPKSQRSSKSKADSVPMAAGGVCHV